MLRESVPQITMLHVCGAEKAGRLARLISASQKPKTPRSLGHSYNRADICWTDLPGIGTLSNTTDVVEQLGSSVEYTQYRSVFGCGCEATFLKN